MNADAASVALFVDGRGSAAFLLWLCLGIAVATGLGTLLPWPPNLGSGALFSVVLGICAVVAWSMGRSREVRIDSGVRLVTERVGLAQLQRQRDWSFADFSSAEVSLQTVKVARHSQDTHRTSTDYDTVQRFVVHLRGPSITLQLQGYDDVREAEAKAVQVGALGGWVAQRSGYSLQVTTAGAAGAATTSAVTVRPAPDTLSLIAEGGQRQGTD